MDDMIQLCKKTVNSSKETKDCRWQAFRVSELLTSGKHALYEVVDITEDNPETFWRTLWRLAGQRLDLNTLQDRLRDRLIWLIGIKYGTMIKDEYILSARVMTEAGHLRKGALIYMRGRISSHDDRAY